LLNRSLKNVSSFAKRKILLVDDELDLLNMFKISLTHFGFEVDGFSDPETALIKYKQNHYDLLLFDIKMEKMNGIILLNEILKKGIGNEKVCFFTASNYSTQRYSFYYDEFDKIIDKEIRKNVIENPETYIIKKPILIRELASRLNYILNC
jgi:DNA-binding response OmpR family regulator